MREMMARAGQALLLTWRASPSFTFVQLALTMVQGLLPASLAWLTKLLLDRLQFPDTPGTDPVLLVAGIGAVGLAMAVLPHLETFAGAQLRRQLTIVVDDRLFTAANRCAGLYRFENRQFLDRLRLAQQSASSAPDQVTSALFGTGQGVLTAGSFIGVLLVISPVMTAVTVAAAIPAMILQLSVSRRFAAMMWQLSPHERRRMFYRTLLLDLTTVKEIRLFGLGDFLLGRMRGESRHINAAERRVDLRILAVQGPLALFGALIAAGGLVWMVGAATRGQFGIGDVTAFIAAVSGIQSALGSVVHAVTSGHRELLLFGHYRDVIRMGPDLPMAPQPRALPALARGIELRDVWFRYTDNGPWVLHGVDLTIPFGNSLALVGLNGAGKSTLVKLLCRLYDPSHGTITWDGVDIRDVEIAALRDRISAVFQDYVTFDLSVAENIGLGDLDLIQDRKQITRAGQQAGIHAMIMELPLGYDTMLSRIFAQPPPEPADAEEDADDEVDVEVDGILLSGGQWQRLALARALLRSGRDLLILDEPSSGLDAAAEKEVHDRLRAYRAGTTSLLISHRLGAVRHADRIAVLDHGQIIEQGHHTELMAADGVYAGLFSIQAANYQKEAVPT